MTATPAASAFVAVLCAATAVFVASDRPNVAFGWAMTAVNMTIAVWGLLVARAKPPRSNPWPGNGGWLISTPRPWGVNVLVLIPSATGSLPTVGYRSIERRGVRFVVAIPAQRQRCGTTEN